NRCVVDIRSYNAAVNRMKQFLQKSKLPFPELSETFLSRYFKYLQSKLNGETPFNYFKKIKRIIKQAVKDKYLRKDPAEFIKLIKGRCKEKDVLSINEIDTLWKTPCSNNSVKYAFLFCTLTGLRFCDVVLLEWTDIKEGKIDIIQKKTKVRLTIPLIARA